MKKVILLSMTLNISMAGALDFKFCPKAQGHLIKLSKKLPKKCFLPIEHNTCWYYTDCIEAKFECEKTVKYNYPQSFGRYYCDQFSKLRPNLSLKARRWLDNTKYCLQKKLQDKLMKETIYHLTDNNQQMANLPICKGVRDFAVDSHTECYIAPTGNTNDGICWLPPKDIQKIFELGKPKNKDILCYPKQFFGQTNQLIQGCLKVYAQGRKR